MSMQSDAVERMTTTLIGTHAFKNQFGDLKIQLIFWTIDVELQGKFQGQNLEEWKGGLFQNHTNYCLKFKGRCYLETTASYQASCLSLICCLPARWTEVWVTWLESLAFCSLWAKRRLIQHAHQLIHVFAQDWGRRRPPLLWRFISENFYSMFLCYRSINDVLVIVSNDFRWNAPIICSSTGIATQIVSGLNLCEACMSFTS